MTRIFKNQKYHVMYGKSDNIMVIFYHDNPLDDYYNQYKSTVEFNKDTLKSADMIEKMVQELKPIKIVNAMTRCGYGLDYYKNKERIAKQ
ncbi:MAG: hypothetical protein FWC41_00580 [Firmicutes bacterium]|nr:hypothetical protein [Bacillota bacterium]